MCEDDEAVSRERMCHLAGISVQGFMSLKRRGQLPFFELPDDLAEFEDRSRAAGGQRRRTRYTLRHALLLAVQGRLTEAEGLPLNAAATMVRNLPHDAIRCGYDDWRVAALAGPPDLWLVQRVIEIRSIETGREVLRAGRELGPLNVAIQNVLADSTWHESVVRIEAVNVSIACRVVIARTLTPDVSEPLPADPSQDGADV